MWQRMDHLILTFVILGAAIALFLSERLRPDLVALLVLVALGTSGVLTSEETFSGFSRSAVITILAIFILAAGLERTGVTQQVGNILVRVAGKSEGRLVVAVMLAGAFLSLFMNNIAAASVLLPAVSGAARRAGVNSSRLLLPLAFSTLLGGMATLFTTTNIVASSLLSDHGLRGFSLVEFAPVGLPILAAGILYMALWGRRKLPAQSPAEKLADLERREGDLADIYHLGQRARRAGVPASSPLLGKTLEGSGLREKYGLSVLAIERGGQLLPAPAPDSLIEAEDILFLNGEPRGEGREKDLELLPARGFAESDLGSAAVGIFEAVLSPRSSLIGQTLRDSHFRDRYGMTVIAIWRAGEPLRRGLSDLALELGDGLLLQGDRANLRRLHGDPDLILLDRGEEEAPLAPGKSRLALGIMLVTLALAASGLLPVGEVMLGGALAMVLSGVLNMDRAYQAIEWKSVFLVAGMLPMGIAMTKTGAAALLTRWLLAALGGAGPLALLAGLVLLAALLTQAMNGAAVAAVVVPVALRAALQVGANPRAMVMGVALATSAAFLTPLGHPVNILVMGPGGYSFRDYLRVGLPLFLLSCGLIVGMVGWIWGL
jgi:di/tricarboxylate transporter